MLQTLTKLMLVSIVITEDNISTMRMHKTAVTSINVFLDHDVYFLMACFSYSVVLIMKIFL